MQREKFEETAVILEQKKIAGGIYSMWLGTKEIAAYAKAGQFVSVYSNDGSRLLPRPISICEIDREKRALRLVYRVVGKGTEEFSAMQSGEALKVVGPLGNGFPKGEKKAFLIGGGIGIPPMLELAKELECKKQIVLGFRLRSDADASRAEGICGGEADRVLDFDGGAYGVRHRSMSRLCLQVKRSGCAFQCQE